MTFLLSNPIVLRVFRIPSFLRFLALTLVAASVSASVSASALHAQPRSVDGRVRRPVKVNADSTGMGPAAGTWVTLHRVGKDTAGPIDSIRTDCNSCLCSRVIFIQILFSSRMQV